MKRLVPLLLLIPTLAFGMGRRPPAPQPSDSTTATYDITTGRLLASTTYGGSKAGQAQETGSDKVSEVLAGKMEPDSEFGFFKLVRYAEDQPDAAIEQRLENNEKGAVAQLSQAMSGNAPVAAIQALQSVVNNAIKEKADYKRWKESQPKPDTAGISVTGFLNGPGSHSAIALLGGKMSETISSKTRATYSVNTETVRTDTTNTNDWNGSATILKHQLELKRIDLEMAKIKAASQKAPETGTGKPPVVEPPVVEDDDDGTSGDAPTSSVDYDKLPKKNFLYKTSGLSRGVAAILIPKDRPKPVSVTGIGGLRMTDNYFSPSEDRHIMRFDGTKGNGPATARVTYTDGNTEAFNVKDLNSRTEYAPGPYKKPTSTGPVDPQPSTSFYLKTPATLTLSPELADCVSGVDALANLTETVAGKLDAGYIIIPAVRDGYSWTLPEPLGDYPKGAKPNTWRLRLSKAPPAGVGYHWSLMQTFVREGDPANTFYPIDVRK